MWTKSKSATLSLICTRALVGIFIAIAITLPFLTYGPSGYFYDFSSRAWILYEGIPTDTIMGIYLVAYACFVFAVITLLSLDRLLRNIRKDLVFIRENVKALRTISWCCFAIAIVMLCGWPFIHFVLIIIAAAAAFFGILMRVVKNVIDAACEIKDENDYTI
jgi:hypothetical protein